LWSLLLLTTLLILVLVGWRSYVAPRVAYYRNLEFPELRRRSPDEIHVLRRHVAALEAEYDRIDSFRKAEVIGGGFTLRSEFGYTTRPGREPPRGLPG
jgi:hypothetical protein